MKGARHRLNHINTRQMFKDEQWRGQERKKKIGLKLKKEGYREMKNTGKSKTSGAKTTTTLLLGCRWTESHTGRGGVREWVRELSYLHPCTRKPGHCSPHTWHGWPRSGSSTSGSWCGTERQEISQPDISSTHIPNCQHQQHAPRLQPP